MKRIAILLVVLVFGAVAASAQVTKISSAEFSKAMDAAFLASGAKVRRETKAIIGFENGKIVENSTAIEEFIPPDRPRSLFVEEFAGRKSETEWIIISGQRYKKAADGGWFKTEPLPVVKLAATTSQQHAENDKTMKFTREVRKIGKNLLISSVSHRTSEDGLSNLKTETTLYTYDPKDLKIEAPIK